MTTFRIDPGNVAYLKLRTGQDYESFGFDPDYFRTLLDHMGVDQASLDARQFASDHFNLLSGYLQAGQHCENRITIEDENKELARIQDQARQLTITLESLAGYGRAGQAYTRNLQRSICTPSGMKRPPLPICWAINTIGPLAS